MSSLAITFTIFCSCSSLLSCICTLLNKRGRFVGASFRLFFFLFFHLQQTHLSRYRPSKFDFPPKFLTKKTVSAGHALSSPPSTLMDRFAVFVLMKFVLGQYKYTFKVQVQAQRTEKLTFFFLPSYKFIRIKRQRPFAYLEKCYHGKHLGDVQS